MIEEGAERALRDTKAVKAYVPAKPTKITIGLGGVEASLRFKGKHGVEILDPLTVVSRGDDWIAAWNQIWGWAVD